MQPSPRWGHTISPLAKEGLEERSLCLLIGGSNVSGAESFYVLDIDDCKAHQVCHNDILIIYNFCLIKMAVAHDFKNVFCHTSHCVHNVDETTDVLVYDEGLKYFHLGIA